MNVTPVAIRALFAGVVALMLSADFFASSAGERELILLRKRPEKLQQGLLQIWDTRDIEIEGKTYAHGMAIGLGLTTRELGRPQDDSRETGERIYVAIDLNDERFEAFQEHLDPMLESLDPMSFTKEWAGLAPGLRSDNAWWGILNDVPEFDAWLCFESPTAKLQAWNMRAVLDESGNRSAYGSGHDSQRGKPVCDPLRRSFDRDPLRELRTMPATLVEREQLLYASALNETDASEDAALPPATTFGVEEDDGGPSRHWRGSVVVTTEMLAQLPEGTRARRLPGSSVERVVEGEDGRSLRIRSTAAAADVDLATLEGKRRLGARFHHETIVRYGGVQPRRARVEAEGEGELLFAAYPTAEVSPARTDAFLRAVADEVDQGPREVADEVVRSAITKQFEALGLDRPYMILCARDENRNWRATHHSDESEANVLNPDAVCERLDRWIPGE